MPRCDGVIKGFGGVIEVATELGDFDGVIEGFDGAIEGATVSYRRCHRRCDGACRFRRCHRRCGGVIEGFDGVIEASSGVRVPPR